MREEFLKYTIFLITVLPYFCQKDLGSNELQALKRYYGHLNSAFFISVGYDQRMREALSQQLRGWKGITLHEDSHIARYWLNRNYQDQNLILQSASDQRDHQSPIQLSQICQSYYPQRPRLMIITNLKKHLTLVRSNDWTSERCAPQIIFLIEREGVPQETDEFSSFLKDSGYISNPKMKEISIFIKVSDLMSINPYIRANDQQMKDKPTNFFSKSQHFASLYSSIFPNSTLEQSQKLYPKTIYEFHMENSLLSIPDTIEASSYFGQEERPIVVYNYRAEKDSIYAGRSNFTIESLEVDGYLFKHVEIINKSKKNHHIYVLMNEGSTNLTITLEDGTKISQVRNPNQEKAQYLSGCTTIEELVKIVIKNRKRSKWPIDPFFPNGDPRRQVGDFHNRHHSNLKNEQQPKEVVSPQIMTNKSQQRMADSLKDAKIDQKQNTVSQSQPLDQNKQGVQSNLPANSLPAINGNNNIDKNKQITQAERTNKKDDPIQQFIAIKQPLTQTSSKYTIPLVPADQMVSQVNPKKQQIVYIILIVVFVILSASFIFNRLKKRESLFNLEKNQQLSNSDDDTFGQYSDRRSSVEQT